MAKLRRNNTKHKLAEGGIAITSSGHLTGDLIELMGPLGFDAVWIEGEHGPIDFGDLPDLTRACDLWGITSLARVNLNLPGVIYRTLDGGAQGITVPHVNTAEEAQAAVNAAKFHPIGERGSFRSRQSIGVDNFFAKANDETMVTVMIEDIIAVKNLPDILKVDNIDVFFVASGDLSQSMGYPGQRNHPDVEAVIDESISKIVTAGRVPGVVGNDASIEDYISKGVRFFQVNWTDWLTSGANSFLKKVAESST